MVSGGQSLTQGASTCTSTHLHIQAQFLTSPPQPQRQSTFDPSLTQGLSTRSCTRSSSTHLHIQAQLLALLSHDTRQVIHAATGR